MNETNVLPFACNVPIFKLPPIGTIQLAQHSHQKLRALSFLIFYFEVPILSEMFLPQQQETISIWVMHEMLQGYVSDMKITWKDMLKLWGVVNQRALVLNDALKHFRTFFKLQLHWFSHFVCPMLGE